MTLACGLAASAQVLARPGWAGSGVAPEAWWPRAVIYRIDPARFQDSNDDGKGDLPGIARRLDYLQSLGVDAMLLDGSYDPDGLDDLIREASQRHLRILLSVDAQTAAGSRQALLSNVHNWLSAGAAGVWVSSPGTAQASYPDLIAALRRLMRALPGERVLLTESAVSPTGEGAKTSRGAQLIAAPPLAVGSADTATLRQALAAATQGSDPDAKLLRYAQEPATGSPLAAADAVMLLASRAAALFDFGEEIGLNTSPASAQGGGPPVMQWTPSNHTPAPVERAADKSTARTATVYGEYHPYIPPPPRSLTGPNPSTPHVAIDSSIPTALPDPDSLPGFTSGVLPAAPVDAARLNVATEDRDPNSLLNAYRQLIGLHHDNATLRNGTQSMLNRDAEGALVWIRRAPAGSRSAENVVVAVNLSDKPVTLALDSDLQALSVRPGPLRPLFTWSGTPLTGETTGHLSLPAHAAFIGEIYRPGAGAR